MSLPTAGMLSVARTVVADGKETRCCDQSKLECCLSLDFSQKTGQYMNTNAGGKVHCKCRANATLAAVHVETLSKKNCRTFCNTFWYAAASPQLRSSRRSSAKVAESCSHALAVYTAAHNSTNAGSSERPAVDT